MFYIMLSKSTSKYLSRKREKYTVFAEDILNIIPESKQRENNVPYPESIFLYPGGMAYHVKTIQIFACPKKKNVAQMKRQIHKYIYFLFIASSVHEIHSQLLSRHITKVA